jgi:hypothetical protein
MNLTERDCTPSSYHALMTPAKIFLQFIASLISPDSPRRRTSRRIWKPERVPEEGSGTYVNNECRCKRFGNGEKMLGKFAQDLSRFYESAFRLFGHKADERQRSTRSSGNYCFLALSWVYRILYLFVDSLVLRICFII